MGYLQAKAALEAAADPSAFEAARKKPLAAQEDIEAAQKRLREQLLQVAEEKKAQIDAEIAALKVIFSYFSFFFIVFLFSLSEIAALKALL